MPVLGALPDQRQGCRRPIRRRPGSRLSRTLPEPTTASSKPFLARPLHGETASGGCGVGAASSMSVCAHSAGAGAETGSAAVGAGLAPMLAVFIVYVTPLRVTVRGLSSKVSMMRGAISARCFATIRSLTPHFSAITTSVHCDYSASFSSVRTALRLSRLDRFSPCTAFVPTAYKIASRRLHRSPRCKIYAKMTKPKRP
jgi:hypothetical protein